MARKKSDRIEVSLDGIARAVAGAVGDAVLDRYEVRRRQGDPMTRAAAGAIGDVWAGLSGVRRQGRSAKLNTVALEVQRRSRKKPAQTAPDAELARLRRLKRQLDAKS